MSRTSIKSRSFKTLLKMSLNLLRYEVSEALLLVQTGVARSERFTTRRCASRGRRLIEYDGIHYKMEDNAIAKLQQRRAILGDATTMRLIVMWGAKS